MSFDLSIYIDHATACCPELEYAGARHRGSRSSGSAGLRCMMGHGVGICMNVQCDHLARVEG